MVVSSKPLPHSPSTTVAMRFTVEASIHPSFLPVCTLRLLHRTHRCAQAVELLRAVTSVEPCEYEKQMTRTAGAVRSVGSFIGELAEKCVPVVWHSRTCVET